MAGLSDHSMDYGLPPRPPTASTAVWKHLLRATTTTEAPKSLKDISIMAPSMAPLDKNATSMRVLLHDTQANFERFTSQVGKLFDTIQETKNELKTMHSLFQRDRESLTGDIVDLVNRSQREIQKSVGSPTQSDAFENLCKNINHRLDGLDQRLEAMNAFNQTHSQALQTQMHAVQLILDKQGSLLSAVTPLLPLSQGLPPLIEALRIVLTEKLQELSTSLKTPPTPTNKRKRTFVEHDTISSPSAIESPGLSPKRPRIMDLSAEVQSSSNTSRVTDTGQGTSTPSFFATSSSPLPPNAASSETSSGTTASTQPQKKQTTPLQNLTTPRRRLNNFAVPLPPPSSSRRRLGAIDLTNSSAEHGSRSVTSSAAPLLSVPTGLFGVRSHSNVPTHVAAQTPQGKPNTPSFFGLTPTATRPPRMLRVHTSIAARSRSNSVVSVAKSHAAPASLGNTLRDPDLICQQKGHPKPPKHEPTGRRTHSNARAPDALGSPLSSQPSIKEDKGSEVVAATLALPRSSQPSTKENKEIVHDMKNRLTAPNPSGTLKGNHINRPPVPGKARERRSPVKEGRRFIPLIDSDDDEENQ